MVWSVQIRIQSQLQQPSCIPYLSFNLEESFFFMTLICPVKCVIIWVCLITSLWQLLTYSSTYFLVN